MGSFYDMVRYGPTAGEFHRLKNAAWKRQTEALRDMPGAPNFRICILFLRNMTKNQRKGFRDDNIYSSEGTHCSVPHSVRTKKEYIQTIIISAKELINAAQR